MFIKVIFVFILGSNNCFCAVLRADAFPEPNDLQSEEQGAATVHQKDFKQVQTCCWFSQEGNQRSVLTERKKTATWLPGYLKTGNRNRMNIYDLQNGLFKELYGFLNRLFELFIVPII